MPFQVDATVDGRVGFATEFLGQKKLLSAEQLTAALFTKLKTTAETALNAVVREYLYILLGYVDGGTKTLQYSIRRVS